MAKKKSNLKLQNSLKWLLIVVSLAGFSFLVWKNKKYIRRAYRYVAHRYYKTNFKPTDFPQAYEVHGIDVSHYQDVLDWKKLKAVNTEGDTIKFRFAFIKATEGIFIEDDMFDEYWEDAKDNGITRGAYHYFLPDRSSKLQANNFISAVKLEKGDLPPVIDAEETRGKTKEEVVQALKEFIALIEKNYRIKPIIYSNVNFIEDFLADDFKKYPFWIAHYYQSEVQPPDSISWLFWQHTDNADLLGISGRTDANVFNGSAEDFQKLLLK